MKNIAKILLSIVLIAFVSINASFVASMFAGEVINIVLPVAGILFGIGFIKGLTGYKFPVGIAFADGFAIQDTTYAGEAASQFIVKAITQADTIQGGHCYIKDNIKKKYTIPRLDSNYEDFIQDRQATPVSKGSWNVDGKVLDPQDFMIYTEFNPRDYEDHWYAVKLNNKLLDRALPATVESVVVQEHMKRYFKYFNKAIWNNDKSLPVSSIYKYWNGWLKNAQLDADVLDVVSPITLTNVNVAQEFGRGYDMLPDQLKFDMGMKIFCSYKTYNMYEDFQRNQTYKGVDITRQGIDTFKGRKVVPIADFPDDTYMIAKGLATPESNLWVGINSIDDQGLKLSPLQNNSELWFIKMLVKADVQIGWGSEVVLYKA